MTSEQIKNKPKNPDPKLITAIGWELLYFADVNDPERFGGLCESLITNMEQWSTWMTSTDPQDEELFSEWEEKLTNFERMILLKSCRPEKLLFAF